MKRHADRSKSAVGMPELRFIGGHPIEAISIYPCEGGYAI